MVQVRGTVVVLLDLVLVLDSVTDPVARALAFCPFRV